MQVTVRDTAYHLEIYQRDPTLPTLLLLHGFMGSGEVFYHLVPDLAAFCNPVTLDLLGHDRSDGDIDPAAYREERQIEDLHLIIRELDREHLFLHGYSMGGRLALRFALQHPGNLSGLILESTTYGLDSDLERDERKIKDEKRAQAIERNFDRFLEEWKTLPIFVNPVKIPTDLQKKYDEIQHSQQPEYMSACLRGFGTGSMPSVKKQMQHFEKPVLLLCGEYDDKYRKIISKMAKVLPRNRRMIVPGAGHRVHLENPDTFTEILEAFITKQH